MGVHDDDDVRAGAPCNGKRLPARDHSCWGYCNSMSGQTFAPSCTYEQTIPPLPPSVQRGVTISKPAIYPAAEYLRSDVDMKAAAAAEGNVEIFEDRRNYRAELLLKAMSRSLMETSKPNGRDRKRPKADHSDHVT